MANSSDTNIKELVGEGRAKVPGHTEDGCFGNIKISKIWSRSEYEKYKAEDTTAH